MKIEEQVWTTKPNSRWVYDYKGNMIFAAKSPAHAQIAAEAHHSALNSFLTDKNSK